jgi:hypothetical protein
VRVESALFVVPPEGQVRVELCFPWSFMLSFLTLLVLAMRRGFPGMMIIKVGPGTSVEPPWC